MKITIQTVQMLQKVSGSQIDALNKSVSELVPQHEQAVKDLTHQQDKLMQKLIAFKLDNRTDEEKFEEFNNENNVSEKSEEDYVQVYFQQQFKERVDPIQKELK